LWGSALLGFARLQPTERYSDGARVIINQMADEDATIGR